MTNHAGWYADPSNPEVSLRYHDGENWTRHVTHQVPKTPLMAEAQEDEDWGDEEEEWDDAEATPRRGRLLVVIIAVLALVAALGGGFYWYQGQDSAPEGIPQLDASAVNAPPMPVDPPAPTDLVEEATPSIPVIEPSVPAELIAPGTIPEIPAAPAPGTTRLEFATAAGEACSKTSDTIAAFDLASLDDETQSPGRFPKVVGEAYTLLATEIAALPAPDVDKVAINNGLVGPASAIGSDSTALGAEADRIYAEDGYLPAAEATAAIELISSGSAAQTMARFTQEYGINCSSS